MIATALSAAALLMLSSEDEGLFWLSRTSSLMEYDLPPTFTPPAALTLSAASWAPCSENLATYGGAPTGRLMCEGDVGMDDQDCRAHLRKPEEHRRQALDILRAHARRRLIEQEQPRSRRHRRRQLQHPLVRP